MRKISPYHNNPNPFAHYLMGFNVVSPEDEMTPPGYAKNPFREDDDEEMSLSDKIDTLLERMEKIESALLPKKESVEQNLTAEIISRLA